MVVEIGSRDNHNQGYFGSVGRFVAEVSQWGSSALAAIREIGCLWDCCSRTPTDADNPRARLITENVGGNNSDATPSVAPNANNPTPPLIPVNQLNTDSLVNPLDVHNEDQEDCLVNPEDEGTESEFDQLANLLNVPIEYRENCHDILRNVPEEELPGFVQSVNNLNMANEDRSRCLLTLWSISGIERPGFVQLVNALNVANEDRWHCLLTLRCIPEIERPECVRIANLLNVPNEHRKGCLAALCSVLATEREECMQLANQQEMPYESRSNFLRSHCEEIPERPPTSTTVDEEPLFVFDEPDPNIFATNHYNINDFDLNDNLAEHSAFQVASTSITQNPVETLRLLAEKMQNSRSPLKTKYEDSDAIDGGGVSRDFVTKLLDALFKPGTFPTTDPDNGLIIPKFSGKIPEKCYQGLGLIFADALNQEICTGCRFHPTLFQMLHSLTNEEIDKVNTEHQQDPYNKILKIYLQSQHQYSSINEDDLDAFVNNGTVPPYLKSGGVDSKEDFLKDTGIHEMIMSTLMIAQHTKQRLTLRNQSWDAVKGNTPNDLREKIEGKLTKADVLTALESNESNQSPTVSDQKDWLKEWINASSAKQLENFMYAISGSKALPLGQKLLIKDGGPVGRGRLPSFHTCSYEVNIPHYPDYNTFKDKFEISLADAAQGVMQLR